MAPLFGCLFGHKWDGCKCARCGEIRDQAHNFDLCRGQCLVCGKKQPPEHAWNGCACSRCGTVRDEGHAFDLCLGKCSVCGKETPPEHAWSDCLCTRCGAVRDEGHAFEHLLPDPDFNDAEGPVREQCPVCKSIRYTRYEGSWEQNPLKTLLEWPDNADYAPFEDIPRRIRKFSANDDTTWETQFQAPSREPDISIADFVMLSRGSEASLGEQIHALFTYFAHSHNPKLTVEHLEAFAEVHGLSVFLLRSCHSALTSGKTWIYTSRNGIYKGNKLDKKALAQCLGKMPAGVGNNILHLLAAKRDVEFLKDDWNEDYSGTTPRPVAWVRFGDAPKLAAKMLEERGSPSYCVTGYRNFPRHI